MDKLWNTILEEACRTSHALCFGSFSAEGDLIFANPGMAVLFIDSPKASFINPTFDDLLRITITESSTFNGFITLGNTNSSSNVAIKAKVEYHSDQLYVIGEIDTNQLLLQNNQMTEMNREINNLQRLLMKEKLALQQSLAQLEETQTMLIHSEKMNAMGQLVAGVAHEINNPISFISSNIHAVKFAIDDIKNAFTEIQTQIIINQNLEGKTKLAEITKKFDLEFLFSDFDDIICSTTNGLQRIKKIVGDLHTFSRHDEAIIKTTDLVENLQSTISMASPELKKKKIKLELLFPPKMEIECYTAELNQVFLILIINAIQAVVAGEGEILIEIKDLEKSVEINFTDNGCGISEQIKDKIFNPFFTTKPVGTGTGLGLSIAYKIITDLHQGSITFTSLINQGTTFTIVLSKKLKIKNI